MLSRFANLFQTSTAIATLLLALPALADHVSGPVELRVIQALNASGEIVDQVNEGETVSLRLKIISSVASGSHSRKVLTPADLLVRHEKLFHFFGFDQGLTHFIHEHPVYQNDGTWLVDVKFNGAGSFRLWADVTLNQSPPTGKDSEPGYECTGSTVIRVVGSSVPSAKISSLQPKLSASDQDSQLTLDASDLHADQMSMVPIAFSSKSGARTEISPFLGAIAHFVIVNLAGDKIYHVHPMEMGGVWMLHTTLPAGDFRVFSQFIDRGQLRTVELAVQVK